MEIISWESFETAQQPYAEYAFEKLIRQWFFKKFISDDDRASSLLSTKPGIDQEPIWSDKMGQKISFLAKYFPDQTAITSVYSSINYSIEKVASHYEGELDCLYLLSNRPLSVRTKMYQDIEDLLNKCRIQLVLISGDELLDEIEVFPELIQQYWVKQSSEKNASTLDALQTYNFNIKELEIINYRKFEQASYKLNPQMNIFAGKNGTGKTSVLESVNVLLGAYLATFRKYVPSRYGFNISGRDPHLKNLGTSDRSILTSGSIPQYPCQISCKASWGPDGELIQFKRIVEKENARTRFGIRNPMKELITELEDCISFSDHRDETYILPLVLYLSSARLWNEYNTRSSSRYTYSNAGYIRTDAYTNCLDAKHTTDLAFGYLERMQKIALEENGGTPYAAYNAILDAVNFALSEEIEEGERVIFSTRYEDDIIALETKDGNVVPFTSLSDGYRNVIKIILDIAVRMCILNPYLKDKALSMTPGIVIIDELDLSLHPTWQKRIVGILKNLFPKIQFICATHSPFIIQSLDDGELQTLDLPIEEKYSGEGIEDIAEYIMGVAMPQYSNKKREMYQAASEYFEALDAGENPEDLASLKQKMIRLEAEYSENPAYLALIRQQLIKKEWEIEKNETGK